MRHEVHAPMDSRACPHSNGDGRCWHTGRKRTFNIHVVASAANKYIYINVTLSQSASWCGKCYPVYTYFARSRMIVLCPRVVHHRILPAYTNLLGIFDAIQSLYTYIYIYMLFSCSSGRCSSRITVEAPICANWLISKLSKTEHKYGMHTHHTPSQPNS